MFKARFALFGHCDNSRDLFSRDGNFFAVVKTLADMDLILKDHLETGSKWQRGRYKNEIISCIAESVRTEVRSILKERKYYSIIADEVTDRFANKEILLLYIRYSNNPKEEPTIKEVFISSPTLMVGQLVKSSVPTF